MQVFVDDSDLSYLEDDLDVNQTGPASDHLYGMWFLRMLLILWSDGYFFFREIFDCPFRMTFGNFNAILNIRIASFY